MDYVVHHAGGSTAVTVNQRYNGGRWNSLGEFDLAPGQSHRVVLNALAAVRTTADAVRFVRAADPRLVQADAVKVVPNVAEDALYVHADHLGTPRKLSDAAGAVVWDAAYTPYGLTDSIAGTQDLDARFPGQWADAESGLAYNYFRDYDPTLGRYLQSDPIGLAGGLNTYAYVGGNPVNYIDLDGLNPVAGAVAGAQVGTIILPGAGTIAGALVGAGIGAGIALGIIHAMSSDDTESSAPDEGPPDPKDLTGRSYARKLVTA